MSKVILGGICLLQLPKKETDEFKWHRTEKSTLHNPELLQEPI